MSHFLKHEPCPKCGSRDNLGVYSDGHKWCFGCRYFVPAPDSLERARNEKSNRLGSDRVHDAVDSDNRSGPNQELLHEYLQLTNEVPKEATDWLAQARLTPQSAGAAWSLRWNGLYLPTGRKTYQIRFFDGRKRKYHTEGDTTKETYIHSPDEPHIPVVESALVLTEDFLSAIRVGKHQDARPLLGAHASIELLRSLSNLFERLLVWLDRDKAKESIEIANLALTTGFKRARPVITELDPKLYSYDEIRQKLKEVLGVEE